MNETFNFNDLLYNFQNYLFIQNNVRDIWYGTKTVSFLGPKSGNLYQQNIKKLNHYKISKK